VTAAAGKTISSAPILAYQPFGDALRFYPHFYALILEGGFDLHRQFCFLPIHDTSRLAQLLRQRTVGLFLKLGLITQEFSGTLLCWKHSGFSVDNSVRLDGGDHTARQAPAQYEWSLRAKPVLTIRAVLRTIARAAPCRCRSSPATAPFSTWHGSLGGHALFMSDRRDSARDAAAGTS
jgi:hypothetical protein